MSVSSCGHSDYWYLRIGPFDMVYRRQVRMAVQDQFGTVLPDNVPEQRLPD